MPHSAKDDLLVESVYSAVEDQLQKATGSCRKIVLPAISMHKWDLQQRGTMAALSGQKDLAAETLVVTG